MLEYSNEDKIELVLNFYTFEGYADEDIMEFPEVMKFKTDNCCEKNDKNRWVLNPKGEIYLHEFISDMTEKLYSLIQKVCDGISLEEAKSEMGDICGCDDECSEKFIRYLVKNANGREYKSEIAHTAHGKHITMKRLE